MSEGSEVSEGGVGDVGGWESKSEGGDCVR
jgi:hypothetical protein